MYKRVSSLYCLHDQDPSSLNRSKSWVFLDAETESVPSGTGNFFSWKSRRIRRSAVLWFSRCHLHAFENFIEEGEYLKYFFLST